MLLSRQRGEETVNPITVPCLFVGTGHPPHLKRVTQAERDEKKKQEKKEKKDDEGKEQEIDRSKMVKYTLGLKHNVWKQKGEEYRVAGNDEKCYQK